MLVRENVDFFFFEKLFLQHFQTLQSVSEIFSSTQFIKNKNWKKLKKKNL